MARLWQCGFELASLTTGMEVTTTSGTVSLSTTTVRTGTNALRSNPVTATGFARFHAFAADQAAVGYQRFYLNIASLPSASTTICRFLDLLNNSTGALRLSTAGKLQLLTAGGTQLGVDSAALTVGTWYMVELKTDATGTGTLDARLDGTSFASGANSIQGNWSRILVGIIGTNASADLFFDDWCLNDASGSNQTSWPGAGKILHLVPTGDGDAHAWGNNANGAGAATNWQLVDEIPPNDATDVAQSVTANAEDMYNLADSGIGASDTVTVVMVGLRLRNNTADATTAVKPQLKKTSGGTIAQGVAIVPNSASFMTNAPVEPRIYPLVTYADPDGAAWTQATLDSMQAGVKLTAAGVNRVQVTALWASVDYTPSTGTSAPAGAATATAAAQSVAPALAPAPSAAVATGTANAPTPSAGVAAQAATATGAAQDATTKVSPSPAAAAGTGTAATPAPGVSAPAGSAVATGAGNDATVTTGSGTNAAAGAATATAAANTPSTSIALAGGGASATAAAGNAAPSPAPSAAPATAAASAAGPSTKVAAAGSGAAGSGAAGQPAGAASVPTGAGSASGVAGGAAGGVSPGAGAAASAAALDATVTASGGSAPVAAGVAAGAASALDATVQVVNVEVPVVSASGGWWGLVSILREGADWVRAERSTPRQACPNDGEPLTSGPDGRLYCPYDGWRPDGIYVGQ